jgi:hypothetical protein
MARVRIRQQARVGKFGDEDHKCSGIDSTPQ